MFRPEIDAGLHLKTETSVGQVLVFAVIFAAFARRLFSTFSICFLAKPGVDYLAER